VIRSTVAHVDLAALQSNFRAIRDFVSAGVAGTRRSPDGDRESPITTRQASVPGVIAVVKANAYGHGAPRVGLALEAAGADVLACADIEEGIVLRQAGVRVPILVFGALSVSDLEGLTEFALTPTISTPGAALAVQAAAARHGTTIGYHLKIDTGMNRLGFRHDNLRRTLPDLFASPNLRLDAVYTHFATADVPESPAFGDQRERFERALTVVDDLVASGPGLPAEAGSYERAAGSHEPASAPPVASGFSRKIGARPYLVHAANSAALLRDSRVWYDVVRPGLLLYGVVPPPLASTIPLQPAMSLTSRVVAVKGLRPGEGVGYGLRFTTSEPRTIAVIPAGYADGVDTRLGGRGSVLIRGRRVPVVGAVSMDMLTVDVTGLEDVQPGDEVVLLGRQGDEIWQQIDARELAASVGTIPWEIMCRLGTRIVRQYD
jgi:alanine racemase